MKEIRIAPFAQGLAMLALLGLVAGTLYTQLPEIRRYLKIRAM